MKLTGQTVLWIVMLACARMAPGQRAPHTVIPGNAALRTLQLDGDAVQVIKKAFAAYGIQVLFASPLRNQAGSLHLTLRDIDLAQMGEAVGPFTRTLFVPVAPHTVVAFPDDAEHRAQYEKPVTVTIEIPNLPAGSKSSVTGLLSDLFAIKNCVVHDNAVTLQATPRVAWQIRQMLTHLYRPEGQVLLQVTTYIVSQSHDRDVGFKLPETITIFNILTQAQSLISSNESVVEELIESGVVSAGDILGIAQLLIAGGYASDTVFGSSSLYFGGGDTAFGVQFSSVNANASLSVSSTRELQDATMHLAEGQTGTLTLGQRYPVLTSTYSALGSTSTSTSIPSIEYEDLGLKLEAVLHLISDHEVLIHLHGTIRSLAGSSLDDIPILDNQEFSSDLSVPDGVSTVMVTSLSHSEAIALQGLGGKVITDSSLDDTDFKLAVTVTPILTRRGAAAQLASASK